MRCFVKNTLEKTAIVLMFFAVFYIQSTFAVADEDRIIVYSSAEEHRNKYYAERLKEKFPQYDIVIEYMPTGNHAARLKSDTSPLEGGLPTV